MEPLLCLKDSQIPLLKQISAELGCDESYIEKDWYNTQLLYLISTLNLEGFEIYFGGGTALAKAYGLISRFSEDVDLKIATFSSRAEVRRFKNHLVETIERFGFTVLESEVGSGKKYTSANAGKNTEISILYPQILRKGPGLRPHIKLEFILGHPILPTLRQPVSSIISQLQRLPPEVERIACISSSEIAAGKLSALCWRYVSPDRDKRLIRHLFDLACMHEALLTPEFREISCQMVKIDQQTRAEGVSFEVALRALFTELRNNEHCALEYQNYVENFTYQNEKSTINFNDAIKKFEKIVSQVRV